MKKIFLTIFLLSIFCIKVVKVDGAVTSNNPVNTWTTENLVTSEDRASLKIQAGDLLTTPQAGALEYDGTSLYFTPFMTRYAIPLGEQTANTVFAGPASGSDAAPSFRALVDDDVPDNITITEADPIGKQTAISFSISGCGQAISPDNLVWHEKVVPCNMTVTSWSLDGDVSGGDLEVDVQASTVSPYTSYSSICGTEKPNVTGAYTNTSSTLSGWTVNLAEGTRLRLVPSAGATHKAARLNLLGDKT